MLMSSEIIYKATAELPEELPLLLIRGAILLPQSILPLPIFDASHLAMAAQALKTNRLIGIIQPNVMLNDGDTVEEITLFSTGTAGKILEISEGDDGKMMMTLQGICRFSLLEKKETDLGYPIGKVTYQDYETDLAQDVDLSIDRQRLITALQPYFNHLEIVPNWEEINKISNQKLIHALMMACPFDPREKQALLESPTLTEQSKTMTTLIEMATFQSDHKSLSWH